MKIWSLDDIVNRRHVGGERYYDRDEVDAVLKRQAAAAIAGMNAATSISAGQVQQAHRLRAESSPEALESERQANAILTERVTELESELDTMNLAVGYFHAENDSFITRIAELERDVAEKTGLITTLQRSNDRLRAKLDRVSS